MSDVLKVNSVKHKLKFAVSILEKREKRRLLILAFLNMCNGILDVLALAIVGIIGSLAVRGLTVSPSPNFGNAILDRISLGDISFQSKVALLAIASSFLLMLRSVLSLILSRKILFFLSYRAAYLSSNLLRKLLTSSLIEIRKRSTQENLYGVTTGTQKLMVGSLGVFLNLMADIALMALLLGGLVFMDPVLALSTSLVFGSISVVLFLALSKRATRLGSSAATATVTSNNQIIEALSSFREIYVKNRQDYFASKIAQKRAQLSRLDAEIAFMPLISKYVFEISVISGALLVSAIQFYYRDALEAVSALAIFLVAGSRFTPAVLRIQQNLLALRVNASSAALTIELFGSLHNQNKINYQEHKFSQLKDNSFEPEIKIANLKYKYSSESKFTLSVPSLTISPGKMTAIIGPSGSGKSTLVDLMLGVLTPTEGRVEISGSAPAEVISMHSGVIAYVPQEIFVIDGSVRENVSFGHERDEIEDESVIEALKLSTLNTWVSQLPNGFDTPVGELGNRLSGGQRQRLGIARALLSKPRLLVLDEATSALDAISENEFVNSLKSLKGKVTLIVIAHRLSSVREADQVVYMDRGSVLAQGTFDEVRKSIPDFDTQASLMGL